MSTRVCYSSYSLHIRYINIIQSIPETQKEMTTLIDRLSLNCGKKNPNLREGYDRMNEDPSHCLISTSFITQAKNYYRQRKRFIASPQKCTVSMYAIIRQPPDPTASILCVNTSLSLSYY